MWEMKWNAGFEAIFVTNKVKLGQALTEMNVWNTPVLDQSSVEQGAVSIRKTVLPGMAIPMLKIRRPNGRLIFNMEIAIRR